MRFRFPSTFRWASPFGRNSSAPRPNVSTARSSRSGRRRRLSWTRVARRGDGSLRWAGAAHRFRDEYAAKRCLPREKLVMRVCELAMTLTSQQCRSPGSPRPKRLDRDRRAESASCAHAGGAKLMQPGCAPGRALQSHSARASWSTTSLRKEGRSSFWRHATTVEAGTVNC